MIFAIKRRTLAPPRLMALLATHFNPTFFLLQLYLTYMNVSDQSSMFTQETNMLISICWKCFLAFNVLNMTRTDG